MVTLAAVPIALWLAALVARPRRPLPGNEVQELVYSRLLGRHERLLLLAFVVTAAMFLTAIVSLPRSMDSAVAAPRPIDRVCADDTPMMPLPSCRTRQPDGTYTLEVLTGGAGWQQRSP